MRSLNKKIFLTLLFVLILCSFYSNELYANTYQLDSVSGIWTRVDGGTNIRGRGTKEIRWGEPAPGSSATSGLRFSGSGKQTFTEGETFELATLTHFNWPIYNAADGARLKLSMRFSSPIANPELDHFYFEVDETPNIQGACPPWQITTTPCDDMITFPDIYDEQSFVIGNRECVLEIRGFTDSYPGGNVLPYFITEEYKNSTAYLVGKLSCVTASAICGDLDGENYACGTQTWPSNDFCLVGEPKPSDISDKFPQEGETVNWECLNDGESVDCSARREPDPLCGGYANTFDYNQENWPTGSSYCSIGTPTATPAYPGVGEEVEWFCESEKQPKCSSSKCVAKRGEPNPWISTRGGFVHSGNDITFMIRDIFYPSLIGPGSEKVSLSTELLTLYGTLDVTGEQLYYKLQNYEKKLTHPWYEELLLKAQKANPQGNKWSIVQNENDSKFNLNLCRNSQHIYFVQGDLNVNPSLYKNLGVDSINGCIFIVKGNINIKAGDDESLNSTLPKYDIVRGYFVSDSTITIKKDEVGDVNDGLKIVGGLFATGPGTSVKIERALLPEHNMDYPTVVLFHDARYLDIARKILGDSFSGYIRDIGLKE